MNEIIYRGTDTLFKVMPDGRLVSINEGLVEENLDVTTGEIRGDRHYFSWITIRSQLQNGQIENIQYHFRIPGATDPASAFALLGKATEDTIELLRKQQREAQLAAKLGAEPSPEELAALKGG